MRNPIAYAWRYLLYLLQSRNINRIHSPFVFKLMEEVICNKTPYYAFEEIETFRSQLKGNKMKIEVEDHGAGSKKNRGNQRSIASIANNSLKRPEHAQMLFRLAQFHQPSEIIELGTSLGLTTLYFSYAIQSGKVTTIEGSEEIAKLARAHFKYFDRENIVSVVGNFDTELPGILKDRNEVIFAFIDGNHRKAPTLNYFNQLLERSNELTVMVFDDIHWSGEMQEAWDEIRQHPKVSLSLDLFEMGLVYFMKRPEKEHFVVRF